MDEVRRQQQREMDEEILSYVREAEKLARVQEESIYKFLVVSRRRKVTQLEVCDRLKYLTSAEFLKMEKEWDGGEVVHFTITAEGMDLLDGNIPPRGWKK